MAISILPQFSGANHGNDAEAGNNQPEMSQPLAMPLPTGAAGPWHRVMSTLAHMLGFGLVALALHEFFHLLVLQALGGEGFITFNWELGFTHFTEPPSYLWAVQLSGGLLTGAFFLLVFWFWAWSSRSGDNTNTEVAAFAWAFGNLAYAPVEMATASPAVGAVAFGIGFSAAALLYFTKLMNWLASGEQTLDSPSHSAPEGFERGILHRLGSGERAHRGPGRKTSVAIAKVASRLEAADHR